MKKVLCFGELLLRFSPQLDGKWIAGNNMPVFVGGSELNVAMALSNWNIPVSYLTAAPDNYLSREILQYVQSKGINTDRVIFSGNRLGTYYLPVGNDLQAAGVIYDRAGSSFAALKPGQIDWAEILKNINWFHFSAISAGLSREIADVCLEGAMAASSMGITVSIDLNFRDKLWKYGKMPVEIMPLLAEHCDVVMGNIWAEQKMLGINIPPEEMNNKSDYLRLSEISSRGIMERYKRCRLVANTFRFDNNVSLDYYATLFNEDNLFTSKHFTAAGIVDKVGSGDTFMAGLIYGNIKQLGDNETINFAAAAAFDKLFIKGDASNATIENIRKRYQS